MNERLLREWIRKSLILEEPTLEFDSQGYAENHPEFSRSETHEERAEKIAAASGGVFKKGSGSGHTRLTLVSDDDKIDVARQIAKNTDESDGSGGLEDILNDAGYEVVGYRPSGTLPDLVAPALGSGRTQTDGDKPFSKSYGVYFIRPFLPGANTGDPWARQIDVKPEEVVFGLSDPEGAERAQMGQLNKAIQDVGGGPIDLVLKGKVALGVRRFIKAPAGAKADLFLVGVKDSDIKARISLKKALFPKDMNQWGGIGAYSSESDILKFKKLLEKKIAASSVMHKGEKRLDKSYRHKISSESFAIKVAFGEGKNRVDAIVADTAPLKFMPSTSKKGAYEIDAANVFYPEDGPPPDDWYPYLFAKFDSQRNDLSLPMTRVTANPKTNRAAEDITSTPPGIAKIGPGGVPVSAMAAGKTYRNLRLLIREALLQEELTKSDKKEIDRLIRKGIEKDRSEQKKLIRKEIEAELKKSLGVSYFMQPGKIRKAIEDVCHDQVARELKKGGDIEKAVVEITKSVLQAWHDLLHKQKQLINRIKV